MPEDHPIFGSLDGPDEPPPELMTDCARAMHCWHFCRGRPATLPLYHAVHGVDDWELTMELFAVIDDAVPARMF